MLEAIEQDYKAANERFKNAPQFATEAREAVVALQAGDAEARRVWEALCAESWQGVHGDLRPARRAAAAGGCVRRELL